MMFEDAQLTARKCTDTLTDVSGQELQYLILNIIMISLYVFSCAYSAHSSINLFLSQQIKQGATKGLTANCCAVTINEYFIIELFAKTAENHCDVNKICSFGRTVKLGVNAICNVVDG